MIHYKLYRGITFLELAMVIVIIAILAAIAIPVYNSQMTKARRAEGLIALADLEARMERYFAENHTYATATIGTNNASTDVLGSKTSTNGHYELAIINKSATAFTIEAKPLGSQATKDTLCGNLRVNQLGQKSISGSGSIDNCW